MKNERILPFTLRFVQQTKSMLWVAFRIRMFYTSLSSFVASMIRKDSFDDSVCDEKDVVVWIDRKLVD